MGKNVNNRRNWVKVNEHLCSIYVLATFPRLKLFSNKKFKRFMFRFKAVLHPWLSAVSTLFWRSAPPYGILHLTILWWSRSLSLVTWSLYFVLTTITPSASCGLFADLLPISLLRMSSQSFPSSCFNKWATSLDLVFVNSRFSFTLSLFQHLDRKRKR